MEEINTEIFLKKKKRDNGRNKYHNMSKKRNKNKRIPKKLP